MLLNSWLPFHDMSRTLNEVDQIFRVVPRPLGRHESGHGSFPVINVYEHEDQAVLVAEVPGVDPDKLELAVLDDTVTLKGDRRMESEEGERYYRRERHYGSFARTLTLPDTVDPESMEAVYKDGVLTVTLCKSLATQPRRIEIQAL